MIIDLPAYDPNTIHSPYAYAVKISNYGKFAAKPKINTAYNAAMKPVVTIENNSGAGIIHYTTDGSTPTATSPVYSQPFGITATTAVKAVNIQQGVINSDIQEAIVKAYQLHKALKPGKLQSPALVIIITKQRK
ncbi:FN3 associated domain-containing protein [Ferruginibacter sp.]